MLGMITLPTESTESAESSQYSGPLGARFPPRGQELKETTRSLQNTRAEIPSRMFHEEAEAAAVGIVVSRVLTHSVAGL